MDKDLIVQASNNNVEIALLEDGKLVEIHKQKTNNRYSVGDIFLGKIKKVMPGLNAAFVDLGQRKDAFLHYTDLGPQIKSLIKYTNQSFDKQQKTELLDHFELEPDNSKHGKMADVFAKQKSVLVQILKEPISTKGPRLTCEINLPGRFMVLTPFNDTISVSKKINNADERKRLRLLAESIRPKKFGMIIRTAAEGKGVADLHEEMRNLMSKWKAIHQELTKAKGPKKLLSEIDKTSSILRDILNDSFNKIIVNDKNVYGNLKSYMADVAPEHKDKVKLHKGGLTAFEANGVTRQIKSSFGKTATMSSGAYLVIEHTEAMHVIDVNSGPKMKKTDQETSALSVNMESAAEIARQLRLRDIGGLIIIDFIDMKSAENRGKLFKAMKEYMRGDRSQHTILPISKFGLMQITRQRARPVVKIDTSEKCFSCNGTGKVNATISITDEIERDLEYISNSRPKSKITLEVHPYIYAYLRQGFPSMRMNWYRKYSKWIRLKKNMDLSLAEYTFYDGKNDEIRLN